MPSLRTRAAPRARAAGGLLRRRLLVATLSILLGLAYRLVEKARILRREAATKGLA